MGVSANEAKTTVFLMHAVHIDYFKKWETAGSEYFANLLNAIAKFNELLYKLQHYSPFSADLAPTNYFLFPFM